MTVQNDSPINNDLQSLLKLVEKPSRYARGEAHSSPSHTECFSVALCFPDVAEIASSAWGFHILYTALKETSGLDCERFFAPWVDMEAQMRARNIKLTSRESTKCLRDFPLIAFSLPYELMITNVLMMLELGRIPLASHLRSENDPIVIAGGHALNNPEPFADFFDVIAIGEGEEMLPEIAIRLREMAGATRRERLLSLAGIPGVYLPGFYHEKRSISGDFLGLEPVESVPSEIQRRVVADFENAVYPSRLPIPHCLPTHDRATIEIMRGCPRRCKFCAAGNVITPMRLRSPEKVVDIARNLIKGTGYSEIGLLALNSCDHPGLWRIFELLWDDFAQRRISLALSSISVRGFTDQLARITQLTRTTQLTFAPEAGSARLRRVIGKGITEAQALQAAAKAYASGTNSLKLYFLYGLPTETDDDLLAICDLVRKMLRTGGRKAQVTVNLNPLIPKPHTPFQWASHISLEEMRRRHELTRQNLPRAATLKRGNALVHQLEAVLSRGNRLHGEAILNAYKLGCRFDAWNDQHRPDLWRLAYNQTGMDFEKEAIRAISSDESLPWQHIICGIPLGELQQRWFSALDTANSEYNENQEALEPEREDSAVELALPPEPRTTFWVRIEYKREDDVRFLSVLEVYAMWDKALRSAGLRPSFTQGFNPRARIALGPALPVGIAGDEEIVDIGFPEKISEGQINSLDLPLGITIKTVLLLLSKPSSPDASADVMTYSFYSLPEDELGINALTTLKNALESEKRAEVKHWSSYEDGVELTIQSSAGKPPNLRRVLTSMGLPEGILNHWEVRRKRCRRLVDGEELPLIDRRAL